VDIVIALALLGVVSALAYMAIDAVQCHTQSKSISA
jgi:hypothetical protein